MNNISNDSISDSDVSMTEDASIDAPDVEPNFPNINSGEIRNQSKRDRVLYTAAAARQTGFASLADAFIAQLQNFPGLQRDGLCAVRSIVLRPEMRPIRILLQKDKDVISYIAQTSQNIATKEMKAIIKSKTLRLESSQLSPAAMAEFLFCNIDRIHKEKAPFLRSILRVCTSSSPDIIEDPSTNDGVTPDINDGMAFYRSDLTSFPLLQDQQTMVCNRPLIAVVVLCLLSYARSSKSNLLQAIMGHGAFAYNIPKHAIETFHQMGTLVSYESIRRALAANADAVEAEIRLKTMKRRFFLSYDNMNFYEHIRDARLHNQGAQMAYTAGYICFIDTPNSPEDSNHNWKERYLSSNQIDRGAVNQLSALDFVLAPSDHLHRGAAVKYVASEVLGRYFANAMRKQKVKLEDDRIIPKYSRWPAPLSEIHCPLVKADVMPLPTLAYNEGTIVGTLDILCTFATRIGLTDEMVEGKTIMLRGDLLTVRNANRSIFRRQDELTRFDKFDWLEPTAGLFHLQMNLLEMLFNKLWDKPGTVASLNRYCGVLKRPKVAKEMKNFHACDTFLRLVVDAHVIALIMDMTEEKTIDGFQSWISRSDWPKVIDKMQKQYLDPFYIQSLRSKAMRKSEYDIESALQGKKEEWYAAIEERDTPDPEPDWDQIKKELRASLTLQNRDEVRENSLLITSLGLLYLDFADACCKGHSGRVEQCIRCFAVIFQGTKSTKYAREMIHMVACLKKIWKKDVREAWLQSCLINISGRPGKFIPDDRFGETIIMLNKNNINPSANAKSDEFLRETISRNVLSLWNSKEVLAKATGSTSHGNHHSTIGSFPDLCFLVKLLVDEAVFKEQLGCSSGGTQLPDLFANGTALLAKGTLIESYISSARGNWGSAACTYSPDGETEDTDVPVEGDTVEEQGRLIDDEFVF